MTDSIPTEPVIDENQNSFDDLDECRKLYEGWSFEDVNNESVAFYEFSSFVEPSLMDGESRVVPENDFVKCCKETFEVMKPRRLLNVLSNPVI